ncbi:UbiA family prenyltransferase [Nocardiopsis rhodophaea]|uniref:UbiA family prenyltransferase n=1 Tax=Nocardiopsis rhodophaea TaxID=280238 RepID=UPI0031D08AAF
MRFPRLAAHVRTWRPYTLWYPGLVGLAGHTLADGQDTLARMLAAWFVPTLFWIAAHYVGDYLDRDLDAISKPHRPIPSGRLRPETALVCGAVLAAAACVIAVSVNYLTVGLLAAAIAAAISYNAVLKARGLWGNGVRGAVTGAGFVCGAMMAVPVPPAALLPFVLVFVAHDTASNLVGTLRDISGDREGGYATFAVSHGPRTAAWTAGALYGLAVATAAVAGILTVPGGRTAYLVLVAVATALGFRAFGMLFAGEVTARIALRAHEVLVIERLVLAGALSVPGLGLPAVLGLLAPILVLTIATQRAMRSRYEFPERPPQPVNRTEDST